MSPEPPVVVTTSLGAVAPDSRLARLSAVVDLPVKANDTNPPPVTIEVTSVLVHAPVTAGPEEPATATVGAGAFA